MKNTFRRWLVQYLKISKNDRNGITILSILIVLIIIVNVSVGFIKTNSKHDFSEFEKALAEWEQSRKSEAGTNFSLFPFNPNTISGQKLDSLLIPDFVKRNMVSYRNAGGKIKDVEDFRKIYGVTDSIFEAVRSYITVDAATPEIILSDKAFQDRNVASFQKNSEKTKASVFMVELNSADSVMLLKLKGVGPVFASRIIKYRDLLGGFYKKEQLLEVYNFPEETFNSINNKIEVNPELLKKIRINFSDFSEMLRHPYLDKEQVQTIINYRNKNGAFQSVRELTDKNLLDSVTFLKVQPYLDCR